MNSEPRLRVWPIELAEANAFIGRHHRHHKRVQGHRFSLGLCAGARLVGVATVGRPSRASGARRVGCWK